LKTLGYSIFPHFYQHSGMVRHGDLTHRLPAEDSISKAGWLIVRVAAQAAFSSVFHYPSWQRREWNAL
jgi:hypothetical protein